MHDLVWKFVNKAYPAKIFIYNIYITWIKVVNCYLCMKRVAHTCV